MNKTYLFLTLLFLSCLRLQAQIDTNQVSKEKIYKITLRDGSVLKGKILNQGSQVWEVQTENIGIVKIPFEDIAKFELNSKTVEEKINSRYRENVFAHRYVFLPSAIPMEKKRFDYHNVYVFANSFSYGITDNWSLTASFIPFFTSVAFPYSVSTKFSAKVSRNLYLGGQLANLGVAGTEVDDRVSLLLPSALLTYGNPNSNFTLSLGQAFASLGGEEEGRTGPIVGISGTRRVGRKLMLISQNTIFFSPNRQDQLALLSLGLRFLGKNHAFNFSLFGLYEPEFGDIIITPFGSYHLRIGGRKKSKNLAK